MVLARQQKSNLNSWHIITLSEVLATQFCNVTPSGKREGDVFMPHNSFFFINIWWSVYI